MDVCILVMHTDLSVEHHVSQFQAYASIKLGPFPLLLLCLHCGNMHESAFGSDETSRTDLSRLRL